MALYCSSIVCSTVRASYAQYIIGSGRENIIIDAPMPYTPSSSTRPVSAQPLLTPRSNSLLPLPSSSILPSQARPSSATSSSIALGLLRRPSSATIPMQQPYRGPSTPDLYSRPSSREVEHYNIVCMVLSLHMMM